MIVHGEAFVTQRASTASYDVYRYTASQSSSPVFPTQSSTLRGISVIATTGNTTLLLVADYGRHTILRHSGSASPSVDPTVFAGTSEIYGAQDGPALLNATFMNPNSVFAYTDGNGNMAVLVTDKNTIRRIAVAGPTPSPSCTTTRSHTFPHTFSNTATMNTDSYGPTSVSATIQSRSVSRTLSPTASPTASHTPTRTASKTESHVTQSVSVSRTSVTRTCSVSSTPSRSLGPSMSKPVYSVTTTGSCAAPFRLDPLGTTDAAAASLCVAVGRQHYNDSGGALPSCVGLNATADNNATYPSLNNSTSSGAAVVVVMAPPNTEQLPPATGAFPLRVAVLLSVPAEWKMVASGRKGGATIVALPPPHATPGTMQLWFTAVLAEQPTPGSVTRWMLAATCSLAAVPIEFSLTWPTAASSTTASTATAVTQATSGMVALASVGTGSGLSSAVSLAMMSLLSCSGQPPGLSSTAYVISVFFDLGFTATAFGNIGLTATATLVHLLVQASVAAFQGRKLFDDQLAYLRFPALSLIGCEFLIPGAVFGAAASLVASGSGEVAAGVIALLLVAAAVVGAHMLSMRHVLPRMTFAAYASYPTGHVWEQTFLFPDSHWLPAPLRTRFKPLVGHTVARWWWLRVGDVLLAASLAIVTGLTIGGLSSACVLAPVVGGLYLVYALVLVVVRPYRCPMDNVCSPLVHVLFGVVCMLKFADLDAAATYVQVALSVVQLWKALVSLWVGCREAQWGSDNCSSTTDPKGQKLEPPSLMEVIEDGAEDALELVDVAQHETAQHDAVPHNSDRRDVPMNAEAGVTLPAAVCIDVATPEATSAQLTGGNRVRADGDDQGILPVVGGDLEGYNALFWDRSGNALTAAAQQQRPIGLRPAVHGDMLAAFYNT